MYIIVLLSKLLQQTNIVKYLKKININCNFNSNFSVAYLWSIGMVLSVFERTLHIPVRHANTAEILAVEGLNKFDIF